MASKLILCFLLFFLINANIQKIVVYANKTEKVQSKGERYYVQGKEFYNKSEYVDAAFYFWLSLLFRPEQTTIYKVQDSYEYFLRSFKLQNGWSVADGYGFLAYNYYQRGAIDQAMDMLAEASSIKPSTRMGSMVTYEEEKKKLKKGQHKAEKLYEQGNKYFESKQLIKASETFQKACDITNEALAIACLNAIYCRSSVANWGDGGKQYEEDMKMIEIVTRDEMMLFRNFQVDDFTLGWSRSASAHPHSMLGYPIKDVILKKYIAESYAQTDAMYGFAESVGHERWKEELSKYPMDQGGVIRQKYKKDSIGKDFRIKVGYLSAGVNSKAVIFLAQDIIKYHDKSKFEVHIFSTGPPDNPLFLEITMRGVDWRERVKSNADYFHDVADEMRRGPGALADYVADHGIHVLIDWDGYCRNGIRAQGLYALRPAPIQIMHQEYLSTSGGNYDYLVTDKVASPEHLQHLYTEKLFYMPHHFFSKGHAMQSEVLPPSYSYEPPAEPNESYVMSTGSPQQNRCGSPDNNDGSVSFVFCNFNKFLKLSPDVVRSWITIMESVPDSIMCLLENPKEGVKHLKQFINDENSHMTSRFHFLPWENNPFDHQRRNFDLCNAILDCHPYNGHTTTMDALYAGVPVVTRSDGEEMSSRVTTGANLVLGLPELNAQNGIPQYIEIAIKLATYPIWYKDIRRRLIGTSLQTSPSMHPFWDMKRYTRNLEKGLQIAWDAYLNDKPLDHITIIDDYGDAYMDESFSSMVEL